MITTSGRGLHNTGLAARPSGRMLTGAALGIGLLAVHLSGQTPPEPGATPGVLLTNISQNTPEFVSVFPQVAVSRANPNLVAVAWRRYGLPIDQHALKEDRIAECHVAVSHDGGASFRDTDLMPMLRTTRHGDMPELWGCNAPWVAIANDGTIYAGGALFTAGGDLQPEPKQGRAGVTVSTDGGRTWSRMIPGLSLDRLAPGLKGLEGGIEPHHTPWDGANGIVDPQTGTMYVSAGPYFSATDDRGRTFGTVYQPNLPGWTRQGSATGTAAFGTLAIALRVSEAPSARCPCLALVTSRDKGRTFTPHLVAQADDWNSTGPTRYPIPAASPAAAGHFAVAAYAPDHRSVKVYYTRDGGQTWKSAAPRPADARISISYVSQAAPGFTTDGRLLVTWRGFKNQGAFNTFVAMMDGDAFGPTVKVSPELSIYPPLTYAGNYGTGPYDGGGDRTTWVTGSTETAFVAFPYAPGGVVMDTSLARVPLSILR
jgi:hypothetical protein